MAARWRRHAKRLGVGALLTGTIAAPALRREAPPGAVRCETLQLSWLPERPRPGTLFVVRLHDGPLSVAPRAQVAGEPLHFVRDSASVPSSVGAAASASSSRAGEGWRALAAAPIDSQVTLGIRISCSEDPGDTTVRQVPLATATYPMERLRVAPRFSASPDSALQARLRREAERAAAVSRLSHDTPQLWSGPFAAPRPSRITSDFGRGREFNGTVTSRHMGTDYAGAVGAPVRAANRGVVRLVDRFYLGGNVVYVDHGRGLVTAYLHLSRHAVAEGDTVGRGQVLGSVGATGRVTGPHLHWIVRYGRTTVDPLSLLSVSAPPN